MWSHFTIRYGCVHIYNQRINASKYVKVKYIFQTNNIVVPQKLKTVLAAARAKTQKKTAPNTALVMLNILKLAAFELANFVNTCAQ